ncbi:MAG TPA: hypothetical protein VLT36_10700 [Candidatus Dormibacteraeota bacterium]|nr:hypothetical protein [Candidatus Dormibacteraeota bacterium]
MKRLKSIALISAVVAVVAFMFWSPDQPGRFNRQRQDRLIAVQALLEITMSVFEASIKPPTGGGCASLPEALIYVARQHTNAPLWSRGTNHIYLNPDWSKWASAATNQLSDAELAAVYDQPQVTNGAVAFVGLCFDLKPVDLTNLPAWAIAEDLLKQE